MIETAQKSPDNAAGKIRSVRLWELVSLIHASFKFKLVYFSVYSQNVKSTNTFPKMVMQPAMIHMLTSRSPMRPYPACIANELRW